MSKSYSFGIKRYFQFDRMFSLKNHRIAIDGTLPQRFFRALYQIFCAFYAEKLIFKALIQFIWVREKHLAGIIAITDVLRIPG